jgi:predicted RNA-binding protein with PIN domain
MQYLIVDGHSVIFAWPELRKLHTRRTALARLELVKRLTQYQDASGVRVVVVFDGRGEATSEDSNKEGIQVFYSATGQTADHVVERLVAKYAGKHQITVATSDHLEQQTASSFGAYTVSAEGLRELVAEAEAHLSRRLKAHRKK